MTPEQQDAYGRVVGDLNRAKDPDQCAGHQRPGRLQAGHELAPRPSLWIPAVGAVFLCSMFCIPTPWPVL
jgi:hypothetical protein